MVILGGALVFIGLIISLIGVLGLLLAAFNTSILWFLGMFVPFVGLVFVALNWEEAKGGFLCLVLGLVLRGVGGLIVNAGMV